MMDIQKPIQMLDGLAKMVNDDKWKQNVAGMRQDIVDVWPILNEDEQNKMYMRVCELFRQASEKCLSLLQARGGEFRRGKP